MNKSESKYFHTAVKFDQALLALLEKKPFEYITISELCAMAQVNRSTFYLHYENTSDLLKEATDYVITRFQSYFDVDAGQVIANFADCELQELKFISDEYLHPYLSFVRENQRVFLAVLSRPNDFESNDMYQKLLDTVFTPILDRFHYPKDEQEYVMMFYLNGITAVISQWLKDGCGKSIEEIATIIHYCIYGKE